MGGYANGDCTPDPYAEGLPHDGCKSPDEGALDEAPGGPCGYYCNCAAKKANTGGITCCKPGVTMGLKSGKVCDKDSCGGATTATATKPPKPGGTASGADKAVLS